jgi:hypothetical protein
MKSEVKGPATSKRLGNTVLVSATNIYIILRVAVMYEAEESHIRKLPEKV